MSLQEVTDWSSHLSLSCDPSEDPVAWRSPSPPSHGSSSADHTDCGARGLEGRACGPWLVTLTAVPGCSVAA